MALLWLALTLRLADGGQGTPPATEGVEPASFAFSPESISMVLKAHQQLIQSCYENVMATHKEKLEGRVVTHFAITPDGTLIDARVEPTGTTLIDASLHACLLTALSGMRFPRPSALYPSEYTFTFRAALPLSPESILVVMKFHQPEFQECYEKMLARRKERLEGKVMTHFLITPAGTVTDAEVKATDTTLTDVEFHACLLGALGTLNFAKPPTAYPVEYPFTFVAGETFNEEMTRPVLISGPGGTRSPQYTAEARQHAVEGLVIVKCTLTTEGTVTLCKILKSLPFMDGAVLQWLAGAHYSPALYKGHPQAVSYVFNFRFRLR